MKYRLIPLIYCGSEPKKYPLFHAFSPKGIIWNLSQNLSVHPTFSTLAVFWSRTLYIAGFVMKYRLIALIYWGSEPKKYPLFHAFSPKGIIWNLFKISPSIPLFPAWPFFGPEHSISPGL